jgi:branched-chain amino acid transport system ATP-binding protein
MVRVREDVGEDVREVLLGAVDVTKRFGGLTAVSDVDFSLFKGEILGLIGPNGAGKTTLFNLISGALPVTHGTIKLGDVDITRMSIMRRCRLGIARTFQVGKLFPSMTALENVGLASLFGDSRTSLSYTDSMNEAFERLKFVGLDRHANVLPAELTMAAQRRLEIARALATKPTVLLLDEVLAGLTPTEVSEGVELIQRIRDHGTTVFIVDHIMKAIMSVSDRVFVLHHGQKIAEGSPADIASSELVREVYLGEEEE